MPRLPWLAPGDPFPPTGTALTDPEGLLAAGADLSPATLLAAYRRGIFPWYSDGQPILWWSPDPRLVLRPEDFHLSRSLARTLRRDRFAFSLDHAFADVIRACGATPRHGQRGTWLTAEMIDAYVHLHELGHAHSVEVWQDGTLVGGLYGVHLDRVFFGESMFSRVTDASKSALALLCALRDTLAIALIDCQVASAHLLSLGAHEVPRTEFERQLKNLVQSMEPSRWHQSPATLASWKDRFRLAL